MTKLWITALAGLGLALAAGAGASSSGSAQTYGGQACTNSGYPGVYAGAQATCQITAATQLSAPETIFVEPLISNGATPVSCTGVTGQGYTTQGSVTTAPSSLMVYSSGQPACELTVTSGYVPAGAPMGTEVVTVPNSNAGSAVQLTAFVCGDPSCGTNLSSLGLPPPPPAPPPLVTVNYSSPCVSGVAPAQTYAPIGCFGTAQPGQSDPDDRPHGHGHHGHGQGDGDSDGG